MKVPIFFLIIFGVVFKTWGVGPDEFQKILQKSPDEAVFLMRNLKLDFPDSLAYWRGVKNLKLRRFGLAESDFQEAQGDQASAPWLEAWIAVRSAELELEKGSIEPARNRLVSLRNTNSSNSDLISFVDALLERIDIAQSFRGDRQTGLRKELNTGTGARIQYYESTQAGLAGAKQTLEELANSSPAFRDLIGNITLILSPPGAGIEKISGYENDGIEIEGQALAGLSRFKNEYSTPSAIVIRDDSASLWCEGIAHELLHHLVYRQPGLAESIFDLRSRLFGFKANADSAHLFVYLGQYYLAGHQELLRSQLQPELFQLLQKALGEAHCHTSDRSRRAAPVLIPEILKEYRGE